MIGLDIGATAVRAAELEFGSGGPGRGEATLVRYGQVLLPPGSVRDGEVAEPVTVSAALRQLWQTTKFESRDVVIGVGNQRVLVRELDLPWLPLPQLKASLPFQVGEMLPVSVDEVLLDFYPATESEGPQGRVVHGMLVAAQRATVNANVLAVEGAGLRPQMVDLNAFALVRALARGDLGRATAAFVDIGAAVTTVVVASQGRPRLVRMLPTGGQAVTAAVAEALSIPPAEAEDVKRRIGLGHPEVHDPRLVQAAEAVRSVVHPLLEAVRNTFVFYNGKHPGEGLEVVVLTGGASHLPGAGQFLASASRLPVTLGDALGGLRKGKTVRPEQVAGAEQTAALSVGLAHGVAA